MPLMSKTKIDNYRQEVVLMDGKKIILRPICPQDIEAMRNFHTQLSEETLFLRFQYHRSERQNDLKDFCEIDYNNTLALVAVRNVNGHNEIIGVGRYYRLDDPEVAEVAFMVQDSEQRKGIGTQLLKHLALLAKENNIHHFVAEVLRANGKMMSIFRKSDPGMGAANDDGSTCTVTVSVPEVIHNCSLE
jgi:RimJ/RimL family protein N-acetyltransferase